MRDVYDFAKYFIKNGADSLPNTYDGNMKLQKLLVFADMINVAEYGELLFDDDVLAFKNGCVVEKVRLRYKADYSGLKRDSDNFEPDFSDTEYHVLNMVMSIFGSASARELSEINHTFTFWKEAYKRGTDSETNYHDKSKSVANMILHDEDIDRMKEIIYAYQESLNDVMTREIINGISFYYDGFQLTDDMIEQLESFSLDADDDSYTVYLDDGSLVIY